MKYFVTGIGTEVGKTVASAFLCRVFDADYWKPVQAGELDYTDANKVAEWAELTPERVHPEAYRLYTPASPHYAAAADNRSIEVNDFELPETDRSLIVEGAGGLLVPLNERETMLDLMVYLGLPVILVARNYLGSINHTLMSIELVRQRGLTLEGIVYSGENYRDNIEIIAAHSGVNLLAHLPEMKDVNAQVLQAEAEEYKKGKWSYFNEDSEWES
mgnify:CR=1 FL=1